MMIISLPTSILTYRYDFFFEVWLYTLTNARAITTPHKLGYFDLKGSWRTLLTPTERRRPWILYLTPGLMAAEMGHIAVIVLVLGPLRRLLLPKMSRPVVSPSDISLWKLAIYLIFLFAAIAILTPLEVIATRLAIQRNHASAEYNSVAQEVNGDGDDAVEYAGAEEDVIGWVGSSHMSHQITHLHFYEGYAMRGTRTLALLIVPNESSTKRDWWPYIVPGGLLFWVAWAVPSHNLPGGDLFFFCSKFA